MRVRLSWKKRFPRALAGAVGAAVAEELRAIGDDCKEDAKRRAPVDTSYMKDHIDIEPIDDRSFNLVSPAYYSAFVEFGTRYQAAQPFLIPAVEVAWQHAPRRLERAVRARVEGSG